jgi:hypothetical protein
VLNVLLYIEMLYLSRRAPDANIQQLLFETVPEVA